MTNADKANLLREAMELLERVDALQQEALGACDVCEDNHNRIQDLVDDFMYDVLELEGMLG